MIRCLISAGPTREYFDPVRYITNPSSGKMGYAMAHAAAKLGWTVDLVSGPVTLPEPDDPNIILYPVETGAEMYDQVDALFGPCDILIMSAAVCDMRPKTRLPKKEKKENLNMSVEFEPVTDILREMAMRKLPEQTVVGFAAETDNLEKYARGKLESKRLDYICGNKVGGHNSAFEGDENKILLLGADGTRKVIGPDSKTEVARQLIEALDEKLKAKA